MYNSKGNELFTNGGRNMYGTRFGWAVIYEKISSNAGAIHIKFLKGMVGPEDVMHTPSVTKLSLVVECIQALMEKYKKDVVLSVYGKKIVFDCHSDRERYQISQKIRKLQLSMISIDEVISNGMKPKIDKIFDSFDIW